jgi:hypothetical protein
VAFTKAKHDWIVAALGQLGLGSHQHDRLYEVRPSGGHRLAGKRLGAPPGLQAGRTVAAVP